MIVLPGSTLGFLGGGQLARMTAFAARQMGYGLAVLDPQEDCAAGPFADRVVQAGFDDPAAAAWLARGCSVVTWDTEKLSPEAAKAAAAVAAVRPGPEVLEIVGDRIAQKSWLTKHGFPLPRWKPAEDEAALAAAIAELGIVRAKSSKGGYDGRSQARATRPEEAAQIFAELGRSSVEEEVQLDLELSVLVAREESGEMRVHPIARNWHKNGILVRTLLPAGLDAKLEARAAEISRGIAEQLQLVGLLAVELFYDQSGRLLVNEVAARTHNTFHLTVEACATSQFEQLVRAVCGLPLGETTARTNAVLVNLLGDAWMGARPPDLAGALAVSGVSLHLYGKAPRRNRKVGHLVACANDPQQALANADEAFRRLNAPVQG